MRERIALPLKITNNFDDYMIIIINTFADKFIVAMYKDLLVKTRIRIFKYF